MRIGCGEPPAGRARGRRAWIRANGAAHSVRASRPSASISATSRRCRSTARTGLVDRRRVSVQWFSGTILTGLCGAALMGGAVFAALDGETNFATVPERVEAALRSVVSGIGERIANARARATACRRPAKPTPRARSSASPPPPRHRRPRDRARAPVRAGRRQSVALGVRALGQHPAVQSAKACSAQSDGNAGRRGRAGAEPDAEVSFVTRDLAGVLPRAKIAAVDADRRRARARARRRQLDRRRRPEGAADHRLDSVAAIAYAPEKHGDPYAGFEPRIVPENITLLPKTTAQMTGGNAWNERTIVAQEGRHRRRDPARLGATPEEIKAITAAFGATRPRRRPQGRPEAARPAGAVARRQAAAAGARRHRRRHQRRGGGRAVGPGQIRRRRRPQRRTARPRRATTTRRTTATACGSTRASTRPRCATRSRAPVIDDLIRIYSYDVDFQRKVAARRFLRGALCRRRREQPATTARPKCCSPRSPIGGETRKFYRYQTPDDNVVDYYDETGKSAKKFLVRKPVADGIIASGFGGRNHPILGYTKMHTGVDWAAPMGTPIYASGNGMIEKVGLGRRLRQIHPHSSTPTATRPPMAT